MCVDMQTRDNHISKMTAFHLMLQGQPSASY